LSIPPAFSSISKKNRLVDSFPAEKSGERHC